MFCGRIPLYPREAATDFDLIDMWRHAGKGSFTLPPVHFHKVNASSCARRTPTCL